MVTIRVSHPKFADNMRAGAKIWIEVAADIKHRMEAQKKSNERVLKKHF